MSYILKALKQAQESRSIDGTPVTAATQRMRSGERRRQIPWRWIAAGALVLNALVLGLVSVKTIVRGFSLVANLKKQQTRGFDHLKYWRHSIYSATAARVLAERLRLSVGIRESKRHQR